MNSTQKGTDTRVREWSFYAIAEGDKAVTRDELNAALAPYKTYAYQLERGEKTGKKHFQGSFVSENPVRFSTLKKKLPTVHWEKTRDVSKSFAYCTKEKTRVPGETPTIVGDWERILSRLDGPAPGVMEELRALILEENLAWDELALTHPRAWMHEKACRALIAARDRNRFSKTRDNLSVCVYFGATGSGKTSAALAASNDFCRVTSYGTGAFDSYQGESTLILDEYRGQLDPATLLNVLDIYPLNLPARYENKPAGYTKVFICSNLHPKDWYPDLDTVTQSALVRRFSEVKEFSDDFTQKVIEPADVLEQMTPTLSRT